LSHLATNTVVSLGGYKLPTCNVIAQRDGSC